MNIQDLAGAATPLAPADLSAAASIAKVSVAAMGAVLDVESNGRGFPAGERRPTILFEPHVFSHRTKGKFDAAWPDISYPKWNTLPYPATQAQRYDQLARAMALDETAALESASWGLFQIMGFNHGAAGFETVQDYVRAMANSERDQLMAFVRFIGADPVLTGALRKSDWAGFARAYNGPNFAAHSYDQKLKGAYARRRAVLAPAA